MQAANESISWLFCNPHFKKFTASSRAATTEDDYVPICSALNPIAAMRKRQRGGECNRSAESVRTGPPRVKEKGRHYRTIHHQNISRRHAMASPSLLLWKEIRPVTYLERWNGSCPPSIGTKWRSCQLRRRNEGKERRASETLALAFGATSYQTTCESHAYAPLSSPRMRMRASLSPNNLAIIHERAFPIASPSSYGLISSSADPQMRGMLREPR
jgi:hypothetical protein